MPGENPKNRDLVTTNARRGALAIAKAEHQMGNGELIFENREELRDPDYALYIYAF